MKEGPLIEVCTLASGCRLYRRTNQVGGWTYYSDEIGGGVTVWDTALVGEDVLLAAMADRARLRLAGNVAVAA